jgi:predicted nucleotidyltransferase component of viral defense system
VILKREIEKQAESQKVPKTTIDKDWVMGHFIDAIYSIPECRQNLVFKGGTCLRKCYYPNYRFSEDLDFTSTSQEFELTERLLKQITGFITKTSETPLHIDYIKQLKTKDKLTGYRAIVRFWGADHSRNQAPPPPERWTSSFKIEIILYERMIFNIEEREVHHPYTDKLSQSPLTVPCYSLQEVLAEKLRALIQRSYTAPRDFYDIWHLSKNENDIDWRAVADAFHKKMKFKNLEFTGIDQMISDEKDKRVKAGWNNSLGHQIPAGVTPEYDLVKSEILTLLKEIF